MSVRGVLSSNDIRNEILTRGLVEDPRHGDVHEYIEPSCYDLTIGYIVTSNGIIGPDSSVKSYVLQPGEVATIFSRQILHLPNDITGLLIPKNGPAIKGLLMLNLGHVDPGWDERVTVQVVNLNRSPYLLALNERVFSIIFNSLVDPGQGRAKRPPALDARLAEAHASMLSRQSLLSMQDLRQQFVAKDAFSIEFLKQLGPILGVALALAALLFAYFQYQLGLATYTRAFEPTPTVVVVTPTPVAARLADQSVGLV